MNGGDQLLGLRAFQEEAGCTRPQGAEDVVVLLERREDDHLELGRRSEDLARRRDAVEVRHANVHQHDVRNELSDELAAAASVGGFAHNRDSVVAREHRAKAGAHQVVVVDK
jgi:hypothetical protein